MSFFGSIFSFDTPYRLLAKEATDYCTALSISDRELQFLKVLHLDKVRFVPGRNALLVQLFNYFFRLSEEQQVTSDSKKIISMAHTFFSEWVRDYCDSLEEPEKSRMHVVRSATFSIVDLATPAERLYADVSGLQFESLQVELQVEAKEFVNNYIKDVLAFFVKNLPKLKS